MITIALPLRRLPAVKVMHHWLAERPRLRHAMSLATHFDCRSVRRHPGFIRLPKRALEVDLTMGAEALLAAGDSTARYDVRRAQRDGVTSQLENDQEAFASYYNAFAVTKGVSELEPLHYAAYWPFLTVTKAVLNDETLCMHAWIVDPAAARASLLYSCSLYRKAETGAQRCLQGRASLFLYWDDLRRLAAQGLTRADYGCFNDASTLTAVNKFKASFPVTETPCSYYVSWPLWLLNRLSELKKKS